MKKEVSIQITRVINTNDSHTYTLKTRGMEGESKEKQQETIISLCAEICRGLMKDDVITMEGSKES